MRLLILGGSSSETPELMDGILEHSDTFPASDVCLVDISPGWLEILRGLGQRLPAKLELPAF